jgi:hypothetical protein
MLKKAIIAATAIVALLPLAASAGEIQNRLNDQHARIHQGLVDGALSPGEAHRLAWADDRIAAERDRDLRANGGHLTPGEFDRLNRQENDISNRIAFDEHFHR